MKTLSNGILELAVSEQGAEIQSLCKISSNKPYIWNANPEYWGKHAPVLFPIIGQPDKNGMIYNGKVFDMPKHGFTRNLYFDCKEGDRILEFSACENEDTLQVYPYHFCLKVIYRLSRNKLYQTFQVQHTGKEGVMPFHIGSHPAFVLPKFNAQDEVHGYLSFNDIKQLQSSLISPGGHWCDTCKAIELDEYGMLPLKNDTFSLDTILERRGIINRTSLYDKDRKPVLTVKAKSASIAYWAPSQKPTPFVCIEPWFGCCKGEHESNEPARQTGVNLLGPGETFEAEIEIVIE